MRDYLYLMEQFEGYLRITIPGKSLAVYRFDFETMVALKNKPIVKNDFITYVLQEKRGSLDKIYVGESMNNIKKRPFQHEDLSDNWSYCYVLTDEAENSYFDKAAALYVEDRVRFSLEATENYDMCTKHTSRKFLNDRKEKYCDEFISDVKGILNNIGLSFDRYRGSRCKLMEYSDKYSRYENGIPCYFKDKVTGAYVYGVYDLNAKSNRENFVLFKGSRICDRDYWTDCFEDTREAHWLYLNEKAGSIVDGVVQTDLVTCISRVKSLASGCCVDSPRQYFATLEGCSLEDEVRRRNKNKEKIRVNKAVQDAVTEVINAAIEVGRVVNEGITGGEDTEW